MNRIILLVCLLLANMSAWANNELKEDFETGMPTSAPSVETQVTLASGTWRIKGVYGREIPGGAGQLLCLPLDGKKKLKALTVRTLSNDVVIGLMGITLE